MNDGTVTSSSTGDVNPFADEAPSGETPETPPAVEAKKPSKRVKAKAAKKEAPAKPKIKDVALELLCEVISKNEDGETVGRTYDNIVKEVKRRVKGAKTTVHCLRWYVSKVNTGAKGYTGYSLPQVRPQK